MQQLSVVGSSLSGMTGPRIEFLTYSLKTVWI